MTIRFAEDIPLNYAVCPIQTAVQTVAAIEWPRASAVCTSIGHSTQTSRPSRRKCETKLVKHVAAAQPLEAQMQTNSCGALIASMSDIGGHLARIEFECACWAPSKNVHYRIIGCKRAAFRFDQNLSCETAIKTIDSSNRKAMYLTLLSAACLRIRTGHSI